MTKKVRGQALGSFMQYPYEIAVFCDEKPVWWDAIDDKKYLEMGIKIARHKYPDCDIYVIEATKV